MLLRASARRPRQSACDRARIGFDLDEMSDSALGADSDIGVRSKPFHNVLITWHIVEKLVDFVKDAKCGGYPAA